MEKDIKWKNWKIEISDIKYYNNIKWRRKKLWYNWNLNEHKSDYFFFFLYFFNIFKIETKRGNQMEKK